LELKHAAPEKKRLVAVRKNLNKKRFKNNIKTPPTVQILPEQLNSEDLENE
jgi:hypothetical protein